MQIQVNCPVDGVVVKELKVRLIAFFVFLIVLVDLIQPNIFLSLFLVLDFYCRAFLDGKLSVLSKMASQFEQYKWIGTKQVDRAPKRFAAMIGFMMSLFLSISVFLNFTILIDLIAYTFISFAFLEFAFGFCAGCFAYHFLQKIKSNHAKN
jgi:hypothetical protein